MVVFVISGELPFGELAAPGAGMMPKLAAALMMLFAACVMLSAAGSPELRSIDWSDRGHAALVIVITAAAVGAERPIRFQNTRDGQVFAVLVVGGGRKPLAAGAYAVGLTLFAYWLFGKALKSPLERGLLWF